ncbi:hypothetical protein [Nocardioides sp.]|uniref:hypothetical protein n=1 Tax=Nocardioides sp. TaxID=35761 RepID=UPI00260918A9|nr:hypothetical protein [Nocardioides sp.]
MTPPPVEPTAGQTPEPDTTHDTRFDTTPDTTSDIAPDVATTGEATSPTISFTKETPTAAFSPDEPPAQTEPTDPTDPTGPIGQTEQSEPSEVEPWEPARRTSGWHPLNIGQLVMSLAFACMVGAWALVQTDTVTGDDIRWLMPIPWLIAGAVGLIATAVTSARRHGVRR